jgi:hypothetical protein
MRALGILGEQRAFLTVALAYLGVGLAAKLSGLPIIFNIYWHYAIDTYVGAGVVALIWIGVGRALSLMTPAPAPPCVVARHGQLWRARNCLDPI